MSQRARDFYMRSRIEFPRYATSDNTVGGLFDEGPCSGSFHRDCRGTFATETVTGVRVQTSTGYSALLPKGTHKPFILHVPEHGQFVRFIDAQVGDAIEPADRAWWHRDKYVMDEFRWDHEILGCDPGHTFRVEPEYI